MLYEVITQGLLRLCRIIVKVPGIARVAASQGDCLRRIDRAPAAYGKAEIQAVFPAKGYALADQRDAGVGPNAPQLYPFHAGFPQGIADPGEQSGAFGASAAEMKQYPF